MGRVSKKGNLFLSAKRKKRCVSIGLMKWRLERRNARLVDRVDNAHHSDPPAQLEVTDPSLSNSQPSKRMDISPLSEKSCDSQFSDGDSDQFKCSTPIQPRARRKLCLSTMDINVSSVLANETNVEFQQNIVDNMSVDDSSDCSADVVGRRVIDVRGFLNQIKQMNDHNEAMGCTFGNMILKKETRFGLKSNILFKCNMCNMEYTLCTDGASAVMDVNSASVAGAMAIGIGHSQLEEFFSALEVPSMSYNTYSKYHNSVSDGWEATALQEMEEAAKEEMKWAVEEGSVTPDGTPILTVVADGGWAKRSYRTNYNSLAGVAAIVGAHSKKVIFLGVRNKYCTICARAADKSLPASPHPCYKNWTGSSSSMEADIILEGFSRSIEMYGAIYGTILADGDSNVYNKLLECRPYENYTVSKIECTNHLLRNYCTKLRDIVLDKGAGPITLRNVLRSKVLKLRTAVTKAAEYRQKENHEEKIVRLQNDIKNSPSHVFGEHLKCEEIGYFGCKGRKDGEKNYIPEMKASGIYHKVMRHVSYLCDNAKSLLLNQNNNPAEHFNSKVAKFVGGKRINFTKKRSYQARCSAAVVSHNSQLALYKLHKHMVKKSPGKVLKTQQARRVKKVLRERRRREKVRRSKLKTCKKDKAENLKSYGPNSQKPDLPKEDYELKKEEFLKSLKRNKDELALIERKTVLQSDSGLWKEERRKLLTASNFGTVCKRRSTTGCGNLVKTLLYSDVDCLATRYGKENELNAITKIEEVLGVTVEKCGLYIDENIQYLGASPDGLIGDDNIVEVKCPESCKNLTPEEAIRSKKFPFLSFNEDKIEINRKHKFFYQIQGQLHITKREKCYFALWTPHGIKIEEILKDDDFWQSQMENKLKRFYVDCILPELVDPRHPRSMEIRNPEYIQAAIKEQKQKRDQNK